MTLTYTFVENSGATAEGIVSAVEMQGIVTEINLKPAYTETIYVHATAAPGSGDGEDGWYWLKNDTKTFYGPKAAGEWPTGVSLVGASAYEDWVANGNTEGGDNDMDAYIRYNQGAEGTSFTAQAVTAFLDEEDEDPTIMYLLYP